MLSWAGISVGIATRSGIDGPGIESQWEARFSTPLQITLGRTRRPIQCAPSLFFSSKAAGAWPLPSTHIQCRGEKRVELYLYSNFGPSWPILRWILLFYIFTLPSDLRIPICPFALGFVNKTDCTRRYLLLNTLTLVVILMNLPCTKACRQFRE
jgi:hypothetical protein